MKHLLCVGFIVLLANLSTAAPADPAAPQIQCILPDGSVRLITPDRTDVANPATYVDDILRCPLQEGETTFVIALSSAAVLDRLSFINENIAATGRMAIAVSQEPIPAASPRWIQVEGNVAFHQKRLFNLSLVGVDARFVKLSFRVDRAEQVAALR